MLIFAAHVEREWTCLSVCAYPGNIIEAFPVRPAVVIDDGLPEVIPVRQRSTEDASHARVDRLYIDALICCASTSFAFRQKLGSQRLIDPISNTIFRALGRHILSRFIDESGAFQARPGPQAYISRTYVA